MVWPIANREAMPIEHRYREVADDLRERVRKQTYAPGQRLPSERDLTREFAVQRGTLRRALELLEEEGLILRDAQRGTFVRGLHRIDRGRIALCIGRSSDTDAPNLIVRGMAQSLRHFRNVEVIRREHPLSPGRIESVTPTPEDAVREGLSGVALYPLPSGETERIRTLARRVPVVLVDVRLPGLDIDFVGFDDYAAGRTLASHLLAQGHRRISFFGSTASETSAHRFSGLADTLAEHGLKTMWPFAVSGGGLVHWPKHLVSALFTDGLTEIPTAIVCSNDQIAIRTLNLLHTIGLRVPQDICVTGFGNSQPEYLDALGLTTMEQPYEAVGETAATLLVERAPIGQSREIRLPMRLVVRRSCALGGTS